MLELISLSSGFLIFFALHIFLWQVKPSDSPRIGLIVFLWGLGLVSSFFIYGASQPLTNESALGLFFIQFFILIFYLFFYAGISRSVSITILEKLLRNNGQPLNFNKFYTDYIQSNRFEDRIHLMSSLGLLTYDGSTIVLSKKGFKTAARVRFCSKLLTGGLEG